MVIIVIIIITITIIVFISIRIFFKATMTIKTKFQETIECDLCYKSAYMDCFKYLLPCIRICLWDHSYSNDRTYGRCWPSMWPFFPRSYDIAVISNMTRLILNTLSNQILHIHHIHKPQVTSATLQIAIILFLSYSGV